MVNQDASQKFVKQGLTFDDVLLIPAEPTDRPGRRPRPRRAG